MRATELYEVVGQTGTYRVHGSTGYLDIPIRVLDCRLVWGRVDYCISSDRTLALGSMWVEASKVSLKQESA